MKIFKSVDDRLAEIGFIKEEENAHGAMYLRINAKHDYVQVLDLLHKTNGVHLIQSYEDKLNKDGFNNMIGLTMYEANLALKKMKQMGWKAVKFNK